jgi:excisionase family DNA binding protein
MMKVTPYDPKRDGALLSIEEAAALANCTVAQMRRLVASGELPVVKVGPRRSSRHNSSGRERQT